MRPPHYVGKYLCTKKVDHHAIRRYLVLMVAVAYSQQIILLDVHQLVGHGRVLSMRMPGWSLASPARWLRASSPDIYA